jgi:hypothetical protein
MLAVTKKARRTPSTRLEQPMIKWPRFECGGKLEFGTLTRFTSFTNER